MSAPASDELRELANMLVAATDSGELRTLAQLREELGYGTAELAGMLDTLRENGRAVEVEPGVWSGPDEEEDSVVDEPAPVRVHVSDADDVPNDEPDDELAGPPKFANEWQRPVRLERVTAPAAPEPTVRLTVAVVDALNNEALGALVKAAMPHGEGVFILEVRP